MTNAMLGCGITCGIKIDQFKILFTNHKLNLYKWWRRRESNPRPQVLCRWYYMLSPVIILLPAARRAGRSDSESGIGLENRPRTSFIAIL